MNKKMNLSTIVTWVARLGSIASCGMLLAFMFGTNEPFQLPEAGEVIGFLFFPIMLFAGMVGGWKWPLAGGFLTVASLVGFYTWHAWASGTLPSGPWFLILASPGLLFLVAGLIDKGILAPTATGSRSGA